MPHLSLILLFIDFNCHIGAHTCACGTANALITFHQHCRIVTLRVELFRRPDDLLRAEVSAEQTSFAAFHIHFDLWHIFHLPLSVV